MLFGKCFISRLKSFVTYPFDPNIISEDEYLDDSKDILDVDFTVECIIYELNG